VANCILPASRSLKRFGVPLTMLSAFQLSILFLHNSASDNQHFIAYASVGRTCD
jgi:hypothetical protein